MGRVFFGTVVDKGGISYKLYYWPDRNCYVFVKDPATLD